MLPRLAVRPLVQAVRHSSQNSGNYGLKLAKFQGQTPTGFIHDGWAMSVSLFLLPPRYISVFYTQ